LERISILGLGKNFTVLSKSLLMKQSRPISLFFFIDGLDEFKGEHPELIGIFQEVSQHPSVKICLSSRP
jgi:hypothetical protein